MIKEVRHLDIDVIGSMTGTRYTGQVEVSLFKTYRERADSAKKAARITNGLDRNDFMYQFLQTVCFADGHLTVKPKWWGEDGLDLQDPEPVYEIVKQLSDAQKVYIEEKNPTSAT